MHRARRMALAVGLLGTARVVPLRTSSVALFLIGRGGRVFLSSHPDGWGLGGGGGLIFFTGSRVGFQLTYDVLRLTPAGLTVTEIAPTWTALTFARFLENR